MDFKMKKKSKEQSRKELPISTRLGLDGAPSKSRRISLIFGWETAAEVSGGGDVFAYGLAPQCALLPPCETLELAGTQALRDEFHREWALLRPSGCVCDVACFVC